MGLKIDYSAFFAFYVVMYKDEIMILKACPGYGAQVMRKDGSVQFTCEMAPIDEFEIIGEF